MTDRRLAELFGIEHPIVLGPFGGLSSLALTARVSELGGLGSFGLYGYSPQRIRETAAALRGRGDLPFSLNLWLPLGSEVTSESMRAERRPELDAARAAVAPIFARLGIEQPAVPAALLPDFEEQLEAVLEAAPVALSLVFGTPSPSLVDAARARGIRLIGTATTVAEAIALEEAGVDAIVASGAEAAGHRVSFLDTPERSLIGTFALVPRIVDAVSVPVIAAGGVSDRRGVAAAFALGAAGVQIGTAFLRTGESAAPAAHRAAITRAADAERRRGAASESEAGGGAARGDAETVLTRAMSGRLARGFSNEAVRTIEAAAAIAPFPAQNWLTGVFRAEAAERDLGDYLSLWAGQAAALTRFDDAESVMRELLLGLPR